MKAADLPMIGQCIFMKMPFPPPLLLISPKSFGKDYKRSKLSL